MKSVKGVDFQTMQKAICQFMIFSHSLSLNVAIQLLFSQAIQQIEQ